MEREQFEQYVSEGVALLPVWVRQKMKNVAVLVEDEPSLYVRQKQKLKAGDILLGLYQGVPLTARGENYGVGITMPDTITIYRRPIEILSGEDPERIRQMVCDTIWHEFAHHFGMNEEEVRGREKKRRGH